MKKNKQDKGSFFLTLIRNYIGFTFLQFIAAVLIMVGLIAALFLGLDFSKMSTLPDHLQSLTAEHYKELPVEQIFGKGSTVSVLDESLSVIYSSDDDRTRYTANQLAYIIPQENPPFTVTQKSYLGANGKKWTLLTWHSNSASDNKNSRFMVLDETLAVTLSSQETDITSFTERELALLTDSDKYGYRMRKYSFRTNGGEVRTLLIKTPNLDEDTSVSNKKVGMMVEIALTVFGASFLLITFAMFTRLNKKVQKPLVILSKAMEDYADGERDSTVSYSGPTEFVRIFDRFREMTFRLSQSEETRKKLETEKQKMLADISHDLKTPITVIQGYVKAICDGKVAKEQQNEYLEAIYHKSVLLSDLISAFSEYSKLEHPDYELVLEKTDVIEYLREYLVDKYDEIEMADFTVEVDIPDERQTYCRIDRVQLRRVFDNLVTNVIKHNPPGTTLYFFSRRTENEMQIIIGDNGVGIPETLRNRIFEPFTVGDESRGSKQGTGLGLAISQKIIEAHGGMIVLAKTPMPPLHTVFEITLPNLS